MTTNHPTDFGEHHQLIEQAIRYLSRELSQAEADALSADLIESDWKRRLFIEVVLLSQNLEQQQESEQLVERVLLDAGADSDRTDFGGLSISDVINILLKMEREGHALVKPTQTPDPQPRTWRDHIVRDALIGIAVAASIVGLIGLSYYTSKPNPNLVVTPEREPTEMVAKPKPVARLAYSHEATWSNPTQPLYTGAKILPGTFHLANGLVKLVLNRGARVTITAPSSFTLNTDDNSMHVISGNLLVEVPESAHRFTITSALGSVVDLGTVFSVGVTSDRVSTAVLEGRVEVASATQSNHSPGIEVHEGFGVDMTPDAPIAPPQTVTEDDLLNRWRAALLAQQGIISATGAVKYLRKLPQMLNDGRVNARTDKQILFALETPRIRLNEEIVVSGVGSGAVEAVNEGTKGALPVGAEVASYLLHFNPGVTEQESNVQASGTIEFQHPILGVIVTTDELEHSEQVIFARQAENWPERMLETIDERESTHDRVFLSADRLTLTIELNARSIDQCRVITEPLDLP